MVTLVMWMRTLNVMITSLNVGGKYFCSRRQELINEHILLMQKAHEAIKAETLNHKYHVTLDVKHRELYNVTQNFKCGKK